MSQTSTIKQKNQPRITYLKDYQAPNYFIDEVHLHIDLYDGHTIVKSRMRFRHNPHSENKSRDLLLNGEGLQLESIALDGKPLSEEHYKFAPDLLIITNAPDKFELEIVVKIFPEKNTALSGLYRSKNTYCTQCEAEGFRRITYFMDRPDILSQFTTTISAEAAQYPLLLSNGNLIEEGKTENGRHWAKWEDPFKKPCYLFALVAGDFDVLEDTYLTQSKRNIKLKIYVEKGYVEQASHAMHCLKEAMRWDEVTYGREYDLDIYMIVAISDFNMGAMENKGLNIFNTRYILAQPEVATDLDYIHILSVVGHEYFHNWSGNRVTCRDWFQLSLKEGLTIFRDQTFSEDMLSPAVMRINEVTTLREQQFPEDAGPLAHPVRPDAYIEINNFYTATVYDKGAEVLRMMRTIIGRETFRKGMDLYFARHDGQAVTIEDYVKTMEDVSGINLQQFRLWYSQAGTPIVNVSDDYNPSSQTYTLTISQAYPAQSRHENHQPLYIPIRMGLLDRSGKAIPLYLDDQPVSDEKVLHLTHPSQTFKFKNITEQPVPSLLRNFSAPVKLHYKHSDSNYEFLVKYDKDPFNRWEAGQQYALNVMLNLIKDYRQDKPLRMNDGLIDIFKYLLEHEHDDKYFLSEMLTLPSERYIGEQMEVVDVDAIHAVREQVSTEIAKALEPLLMRTYLQNDSAFNHYVFGMEEIGKRQLKNRCLLYLCHLPQHAQLAMKQFEKSLKTNMSDTQPALVALCNLESPLKNQALDAFYHTWQDDALVVDKWLAIQACSKLPNALHEVKRLLRSDAFDIKNPNKVYSLIGSFGNRNAVNFHAHSGEGYAFLRETVSQLDKLNPQVAGRMVKPLTNFKRYDKERQILMREQLELLLSEKKISSDLYEIVTKSLE